MDGIERGVGTISVYRYNHEVFDLCARRRGYLVTKTSSRRVVCARKLSINIFRHISAIPLRQTQIGASHQTAHKIPQKPSRLNIVSYQCRYIILASGHSIIICSDC